DMGLAIEGRRAASAWRTRQKRAHGAERIRQGHHRAAMKRAAGRAELWPHEKLAHDSFGRRFGDLHAECFGEGDERSVERHDAVSFGLSVRRRSSYAAQRQAATIRAAPI